ncbi:MAG TPA: FecR domain-containing protein [Pyrinomonadaceae bacterium]
MTAKNGRFNLDWWVVQKRQIYFMVALVVVGCLAGGVGLYVWKYGNPFKTQVTTVDAPAGARFISFEGDVRIIRASTRETLQAANQVQLYPGDTVQTQADGRARISMIDGSTLVVRPNSTVIIRDNTSFEGGKRTDVRVRVGSGQVNVRTEQQPEGTSNIVETPQTQNQLGALTGASFGVDPDNKTEEIRVTNGAMETVTTRDGEKTTVRGGEYLSVAPSGSLTRRESLLAVPSPIAPRDMERVFVKQSGAASVALRWHRPQSGSPAHYRVEVATSPFFVAAGKVIERDQLSATEFNVSDLRPGSYFWRVRATASSGQTSDWSDPQKFVIVTGGTGQTVSVSDLSAEYVGGQIYLIRGRAQYGTTIRVAGRETLTGNDERFQLQITAPAEARELALEALDSLGNSSQYKVALAPTTAQQRN